MTRLPLSQRRAFAPSSATSPANSSPEMFCGTPAGAGYTPKRCSRSARLSAVLRTRTRTSSGPGCGAGTSWISKTSGPPNAVMTTALMACSRLLVQFIIIRPRNNMVDSLAQILVRFIIILNGVPYSEALLIYLRNNIVDGLAQKRRYTNQSANGAQYDSQGQARSASPLVCNDCNLTRPERPKYDRYHTLSRSTWAVYLLPRASASA